MQTGRRICFVVLFAMIAVLVSCDTASQRPARAETAGEEATPEGLRAAAIAVVQAQASEAYRVERTATGLSAANVAQGLMATFTGDGVELVPAKAALARWSEAPARWGCEGALSAVKDTAPEASGNRVEYRREGFVEWYVNGPLGLEQGFTLKEAPPCRARGGGAPTIALASRGDLTPALIEGGHAVALRDAAGRAALMYTDLHVVDAAGRSIPARLGVGEGSVSIRVDDEGAVYPLVIDPLIVAQQAKLLGPGSSMGAAFGFCAAIEGDTALIGAFLQNDNNTSLGAAYVFVRAGLAWKLQQKLVPSGAPDGAAFGVSVALSGDTALVGAYLDSSAVDSAGAAYVFTRTGATWTQQQKLLASDPDIKDEFGVAVGLSGDTAVVGTNNDADKGLLAGSAYIFVRSGNTWTQQQKLLASDGTTADHFGDAVAIAGDTLLVGASGHSDNGTFSGAVYAFTRAGVTWTEQQKLVPGDNAKGDLFGKAIAISGTTAVVGAPQKADLGIGTGAAYVFVDAGATWTEQQRLLPMDGMGAQGFGISVGISGDTAVVGAAGDDDKGQVAGAAYVFTRSGATWTQQQKLLAMDGAADDHFGLGVAVSNDTIVVGSPYDDDLVPDSGSAYIFVPGLPGPGAPCATAAGCATGFCVDGVCCDSECGGGTNDCQACNLAGAWGICSLTPMGMSCRPSVGVCDTPEMCDGKSLICPPDVFAPDGTACESGTCQGGMCKSTSAGPSGSGAGGAGGSVGPVNEGGCGCRTADASSPGSAGWLVLGVALAMRRRRSGWARVGTRRSPISGRM